MALVDILKEVVLNQTEDKWDKLCPHHYGLSEPSNGRCLAMLLVGSW